MLIMRRSLCSKSGSFGLVLVVVFCLGLTAGSAFAVRGHVFMGSFGSPGSGPGQLEEPSGVAVNEADGVAYVVDKGDDRVQWFAPNGLQRTPGACLGLVSRNQGL